MKAVCPRDQVAYDVKTGCPDCVARERDAYLARGVPDDDAVLYSSGDAVPWEGSAAEMLAELAELAERFKPVPCAHTYSLADYRCMSCGEPLSIAMSLDFGKAQLSAPVLTGDKYTARASVPWKLGTDANGSPVADLAADAALLGLE